MTSEHFDFADTFSLLIWEIVPEDTKLYLIPNTEADKFREALAASHGHYVNWDVDRETVDQINKLSALIAEKPDYVEEENKDIATLWSRFFVDKEKPIVGKIITAIYLTGFIL